jgi:drug/metabolite transporter (DMT)-like permease
MGRRQMKQARPDKAAPEWQIWAALLVVYIVWGSTYLAIRVVVGTMPPLLSAGVRFVIAAAILFAYVALRHGLSSLKLSRSEWLGAAFVGLALLLGGNGLVMLGERDVPSGLAALIVAVIPLYVVLLRFIFRERVAMATVLGVLIGFVGVAVLIVPRGIDGSVAIGGMLLLLLAPLSWSIGTFYSKRVELPGDYLVSTGAQMLVGGIGLLLVGLLVGEAGLVTPRTFSTESLLALAYLIVFGSVLAYTAYTWLLQHAPVSRVATYAFVNPVVAIVLGALLLNEEINATMLIGAAMIVVAVAVVVRTESQTPHSESEVEATPAKAPEVAEAVSPPPA